MLFVFYLSFLFLSFFLLCLPLTVALLPVPAGALALAGWRLAGMDSSALLAAFLFHFIEWVLSSLPRSHLY